MTLKTESFEKNEIDIDFGICNVHSLAINDQGDSAIVAGTKYQPHLGRVVGKVSILSLEGMVLGETWSETAIYDAKFIDDKTFVTAHGQNWSV